MGGYPLWFAGGHAAMRNCFSVFGTRDYLWEVRLSSSLFFVFFNIGATGFEGVGEDCRYLAVVTLYPDYFFRKKFAELRETLYLCGVKNKDSQNK